jgi:hypothetical protein
MSSNEEGGWYSPKVGDFLSLPALISGYVDTTYTGSLRVGISLRRNGVEYYREVPLVEKWNFSFRTSNLLLGPGHLQGYVWQPDDRKDYFPDIDFIYVLTPPEENELAD